MASHAQPGRISSNACRFISDASRSCAVCTNGSRRCSTGCRNRSAGRRLLRLSRREDPRAAAAFADPPGGHAGPDANSRTGSRNVSQAGPIRPGRCGSPAADPRAASHSPQPVAQDEAGPVADCVLIEQDRERRRSPADAARRPSTHASSARRCRRSCPRPKPSPCARSFRELGVRVVKIGTVFERMSYDKDVIAVQAGKPVEFVLRKQRLDAAQLRDRSSRARSRKSACSPRRTRSSRALPRRHYVPRSSKILAVEPSCFSRGIRKRLSFDAPIAPGVYPYRLHLSRTLAADVRALCTWSTTWTPIWPIPRSTWPSAKLEPRDALLKDRRPRTEWTLADLAAPVEEMTRNGGRNFGSGRQIFTVANCVACHRLQGVGNSFGPDLTKLDPKWKPADILNEILEPVRPHQREVSNQRLRAGFGQSRDGTRARRERRDDQDHRKSVGQSRSRRSSAAATSSIGSDRKRP